MEVLQLEACVHYFSFFHQIIALNNYEKCFLFHDERSFFLKIFKSFHLHLFFPLLSVALEDEQEQILKFISSFV